MIVALLFTPDNTPSGSEDINVNNRSSGHANQHPRNGTTTPID
jgi:hypothetical protein